MARGSVAIVLGTYNRLAFLQRAVASIRRAARPGTCEIIVVDGGSTDGSLEWMAEQIDVRLIRQRELCGAVRAFNAGFADAVERRFDYIGHFNDDAEFVHHDHDHGSLVYAADLLERDPKVGAVAFAFDLRGEMGFEFVNGLPYSNFGLVRAEAGRQVSARIGDPTGRTWWNPIYHTYGADSEFGCWLWHLGWRVEACPTLCVHDCNARDGLRDANEKSPRRMEDGRRFWARWPSREHITTLGPAE